MDGLAKVAWSQKQLDKSIESLKKALADSKISETMSKDEIKKIRDYVKTQEGLNIGTFIDESVNPFDGAYANYNAMEEIKRVPASNLESRLKLLAGNYNNEQDGMIISPNRRETFTHELGHAIDRKRNPNLYALNKWGKISRIAAEPAAILSSGAGALLLANEDEKTKGILPGATSGIAAGGGLVGLGSALVNRGENAANKYGDEIISKVYQPEEAKMLIENALPLRTLSKKTYTVGNLAALKNALIGTGIGTAAGLGLSLLKNTKSNEKEAALF